MQVEKEPAEELATDGRAVDCRVLLRLKIEPVPNDVAPGRQP